MCPQVRDQQSCSQSLIHDVNVLPSVFNARSENKSQATGTMNPSQSSSSDLLADRCLVRSRRTRSQCSDSLRCCRRVHLPHLCRESPSAFAADTATKTRLDLFSYSESRMSPGSKKRFLMPVSNGRTSLNPPKASATGCTADQIVRLEANPLCRGDRRPRPPQLDTTSGCTEGQYRPAKLVDRLQPVWQRDSSSGSS